jgi:hypothetical protein
MIKSNAIIIAPNINISQYILEDKEEELMELLARESLTDPSIITATTEDFEAGFVAGVKHQKPNKKNQGVREDAINRFNSVIVSYQITACS